MDRNRARENTTLVKPQGKSVEKHRKPVDTDSCTLLLRRAGSPGFPHPVVPYRHS